MISESELARAAEAIRAGKLVAFPTETVYGLGANALDADAVERIFAAKGRPKSSPLIVHVASVEEARKLAAAWPRQAELLAARFWPGPLTLVLPKVAAIPGIVTADLDTVGLRVPANEIALALIRASGLPIAAPSANRFTELSPTRAEHVRASLGDEVAVILDGGPTDVGIESTVVAVGADGAVMLRPGVITREELACVIGPLGVAATSAEPARSPGMHARHYQPKTRLFLSRSEELPPGHGAFLYRLTAAGSATNVQMPLDPRAYAARLYDVLHELDRRGLDWIAVEPVPEAAEWEGVRDRLWRAAAR